MTQPQFTPRLTTAQRDQHLAELEDVIAHYATDGVLMEAKRVIDRLRRETMPLPPRDTPIEERIGTWISALVAAAADNPLQDPMLTQMMGSSLQKDIDARLEAKDAEVKALRMKLCSLVFLAGGVVEIPRDVSELEVVKRAALREHWDDELFTMMLPTDGEAEDEPAQGGC